MDKITHRQYRHQESGHLCGSLKQHIQVSSTIAIWAKFMLQSNALFLPTWLHPAPLPTIDLLYHNFYIALAIIFCQSSSCLVVQWFIVCAMSGSNCCCAKAKHHKRQALSKYVQVICFCSYLVYLWKLLSHLAVPSHAKNLLYSIHSTASSKAIFKWDKAELPRHW